ncbi:hypothetical protein EN827_15370 [Mesorhizobium sp. M1D.F.Ca.ET.184.01.1.1]|nr:hypothetical protein EN874_015370 [Mesorhizobium sp. M1D.F.Ca.ET.231.01.1.1]TGP32041.1 hypothetical protein EN877_15375 [Mesorhizobium sp. M1D.F.Ca.ET.234.01.1.1]TGS46504.1 hypothetical protein EN827_15370 [Mesorhizobium sp. M1D.F.Ca.ET.184.01.1.1]TGS61331.1 hypothetical protein EN826_015370 [Mesorhizobium sp. M1D.F.Ca.ET.183.01.1.1]TIT80013.1 MAG: hypothetical protein E5W57_04630 [Mesorhizobium sp.]
MSGVAQTRSDCLVNSASSLNAFLVNISAGFCAFTIVVYQTWFMPFSLPLFAGRDEYVRMALYAVYCVVLAVSITVIVVRRDVRKFIWPLAFSAAMAVVPIALHPIGLVNRSYLITLALGGSTIVLMLASAPSIALRLSASVTALNAIVCFLDIFFVHGFTGTLGRAAGLAINPNVAAAGLLLGAAASYRGVAKKWRASFLVLVAGALVVTLSRSTLLAAAATLAAPIAIRIWQRYRTGWRFQINNASWARALAVACLLVGVTSVASMTNRYFRIAIGESFAGALSVSRALDEATKAVDTLDRRTSGAEIPSQSPEESSSAGIAAAKSGTGSAPPGVDTAALSRPPSNPAPPSAVNQSKMQALDKRLTDEGKRNSISARALFLERGLLAYREGGFFGRGLEEAQALAPHNTFVLFAVAFGHLGWLIPIGLAAFAFYFVREARDLAVGIAVIGVMMTSHDLLLTPSLFIPVALGIGGMLAARVPAQQSSPTRKRTSWSFASGTVAGIALFAAACVAIFFLKPLPAAGLLVGPLCFIFLGTIIAWSLATLSLFRHPSR